MWLIKLFQDFNLIKRLRPFIQNTISPFQTSFLLGRWIIENTLLVHEKAHTISKKKQGKVL